MVYNLLLNWVAQIAQDTQANSPKAKTAQDSQANAPETAQN